MASRALANWSTVTTDMFGSASTSTATTGMRAGMLAKASWARMKDPISASPATDWLVRLRTASRTERQSIERTVAVDTK